MSEDFVSYVPGFLDSGEPIESPTEESGLRVGASSEKEQTSHTESKQFPTNLVIVNL